MSKHPINDDIKKSCASIVKEITGKEINEIIPEGENRLKLYKIYQIEWSKTNNYHNAEKAARKWIRSWEKAKAAVKMTYKALKNKDIKEELSASKRSKLYWTYIEKGEDEAISVIKKL